MALRLSFLMIGFILLSCAIPGDQVFKSRIDAYYADAPGRVRPGSDSFYKPMLLEKGQYVLHGIEERGRRSIVKTSVLGHEGDAWIVEIYTLTESNETAVQMLVRGLERAAEGAPESLDVLWVRSKQGSGEVQRLDGPGLGLAKGMYKDMLGIFTVKLKGAVAGGAVRVPAGAFPHTYKTSGDVRFPGWSYKSEAWYHSGVPINALVKSVAKGGGPVMELLDYGLDGASGSF